MPSILAGEGHLFEKVVTFTKERHLFERVVTFIRIPSPRTLHCFRRRWRFQGWQPSPKRATFKPRNI